jgi:hypothetical protein
MRRVLVVLFAVFLLNSVSAVEFEGGVDVDPDLEGTPFVTIDHTTPTSDLQNWNITITLTDEAATNNTTFTLITQICNNDGVCLPPEGRPLSTDNNITFISNVTAIENHSYVNWKLKATYNDDNETNETFPDSGYYKTWSDCWYYDGKWGGDECPEDINPEILIADDGSFLPTISAFTVITILSIAAIIRRD